MAPTKHHEILKRLILPLSDHPSVVEVGVAGGKLSEYLLREIPSLNLHMVDSWEAVPGHPTRDQKRADRIYHDAILRTSLYEYRRYICRMRSLRAADRFSDIDLVFIDADHTFEHVLADCVAWWLTVRKGGILCGHDYRGHRKSWGVDRAVDWFANEMKLELELKETVWILRKP